MSSLIDLTFGHTGLNAITLSTRLARISNILQGLMSYLSTSPEDLKKLNREGLYKLMENLFAWTQYYMKIKKDFHQYSIMQNRIRQVQRVMSQRYPKTKKETAK